ncbi:hypothetical protein QBC32DRAFT_357654 [Pseudoneurospora amorphoporcata]|uniref:Uncharacterized protein n=1 Tax=Pseudoneurospora amorphoporcata TaxID=241081 RepID=A0AAN6SAJ5_9PEZI|nr:hypothetical protein QBC32DRAFT_357654 [Pseudoneurospora amorphoporcata]
MFHSWLLDILSDLDVYKTAAKDFQNNPHAEDAVLDKLASQCHNARCPCLSPETREFRKGVLRILFLNLNAHWLATLLDWKEHKKNQSLIKRFKEELRKRRREERRERRKMDGCSLKDDDEAYDDDIPDDISEFYELAVSNFADR